MTMNMAGEHTDSQPAGRAAMQARAMHAYAKQSREAQEEQWILSFLPLVRHVVSKVASQVRVSDQEDLISAGTLGLVKAARSYDASREAEFKTYAYIRIRGAVLDELRARSWVPSAVHGQIRAVEAAYQQAASRLGRPPDDEELAAEAQIPVGQLYRLLEEARRQHFLSIHGVAGDAPAGSANGPLAIVDRAPGPDAAVERQEVAERLALALGELTERDRMLILLYYERDLTMKEIAEVLGVTESRVSQLHAAAVFKLAMRMRSHA